MLILLSYPYLDHLPHVKETFLRLMFTGLLFSAVYAMSDTKAHLFWALALGVPVLLFNGVSFMASNRFTEPAHLALFAGFDLYTTLFIFRKVLSDQVATRDALYGAICVYLLMGLTWAVIYQAFELAIPGSFTSELAAITQGTVTPGHGRVDWAALIYFSFATLTNTGFGDLVPMNTYAQSAAITEAIAGILYVAIIIPRLVGLHLYDIQRKA